MGKRVKNIILFFLIFIFFLGIGFYLGGSYYNRVNLEKIEDSILVADNFSESKTVEARALDEDKKRINILAAGDIMYHMPQVKAAYDVSNDSYNFDNNFKYVRDYIQAADIALVNYESVAGGDHLGFKGYPNFNSPVSSLDSIKNAGFDIVSTANNHMFDQGKDGLISTMDELEKRGMDYIGSSKEVDKRFLIKDVNGIRIGFLSYTYGLNGREAIIDRNNLNYMVNLISEEQIESDIKELKKNKVDLIVSFIHWGTEYSTTPNSSQLELSDKIFDWGGDIILGSHPHVVQKAELENNKFVIYSMGNFISNQRKETINDYRTEDGLIVDIQVEKDFINDRVKIVDVEYIPTWTYKYYNNTSMNYEILPIRKIIDEGIDVFNRSSIIDRMEKSYNRTMDTIESK